MGWLGGIMRVSRIILGAILCSLQVRAKVVKESVTADYDYSWAMDAVNRTQIREYLIELSREPHMAGLERDEYLATWMKQEWERIGLDEVRLEGYSMLLDYPDKEHPNLVTLNNKEGEVIYTSHFKEEGVDDPNFVDAFNAYSKSGTATGAPVYVNYGRIEDFEYLKTSFGNDLTQNRVCLARYGKIFRGNKAENAENAGCVGLVIFMDPSSVAMEGTDEANVFPNTFWMPGTAVQRGSLSLSDGDPLTPNWPSLEHVYRLNQEDRQQYLPQIPVQPIGYTDAEEFLQVLGGQSAPEDWQGGLNLTYNIGGEFNSVCGQCQMTIQVNNKLEERVSSNVIGILWGEEEPDKYVMLGNHRDAWGFGAVDPNSGTAQMMEVARVMGSRHLSEGWRPKRTIMFLSWGAEEYSLCGSREWVEQYEAQLAVRGVAYLNTDVCMSGPILYPVASPTLGDLFTPALHDISSPEDENESYYTYLRRWAEGEDAREDWKPEVDPFVGAGSDHATFQFYAGIPVVDIMFEHDSKVYPGMSGYPAYHTGFETFDLVDKIYDPEFKIFGLCSQLNLRLSLQLAESKVLPFTMEKYADVMEEGILTLADNGVLGKLTDLDVDYQYWNASVFDFRQTARNFDSLVQNVLESGSDSSIRVVNEQMRGFERTLLLLEGLPGRIQYRHMVTAPSMFDAYGGSAFPGIGDLLYGVDDLSEEDRTERVKIISKHVSDLMITIKRAEDFLRPIVNVAEQSNDSSDFEPFKLLLCISFFYSCHEIFH